MNSNNHNLNIPKVLIVCILWVYMGKVTRLSLAVRDTTFDLYYKKFYEAKSQDRTLTHDKFIKGLFGLR